MKEIVQEILSKISVKGSFLRNLSFTFFSNFIVFVIGFLFYPLQTKFYSPEAYAQYSIAAILLNNLFAFCRLGYSDALITAKHNKEYYQLMSALTFMSIGISFFFLIIFWFFEGYFWGKFDVEGFGWIYLVFFIVILSSLQNSYGMGNIRFGLLERRSKVNGILKLSSRGAILILGYFGLSSGLGLLAGNSVFFLGSAMFLLPFKKIRIFIRELFRFDFKKYKQLLFKYIDFPKFVFPAIWVIVLTEQFPLWFIGFSYSSENLGLFAFVIGILRVPLDIINKSIRPVFFKKNMDFKTQSDSEVRNSINKVIKVFYVLMFLYIVLGYWSIEMLYEFLFDAKWIAGKELMQVMTLSVSIMIVASPMANVFKVNNKMKLDLGIRIFILILFVASSLILSSYNVEFLNFAIFYSVLYFIGYYIFFLFQLREFKFSFQEILTVTIKFLAIIASSYVVTILLKDLLNL